MRVGYFCLLFLVLLAGTVLAASVDTEVEEAVSSEGSARVIVTLRDDSSFQIPSVSAAERKQSAAKQLSAKKNMVASVQERVISSAQGFKVKRRYSVTNSFAGEVNAESLESLINNPDVESVQIDRVMSIFMDVSVPLINATKVWPLIYNSTNLTGKGQTVCVIDTGVDSTHPDLNNTIVAEYCYCSVSGSPCCPDGTNQDDNSSDDHGHGTHVIGTVASNNDTYRGVAPDAKIVSIKVCDSSGYCESSDIISGIDWCVANSTKFNISVISMSLGGNTSYDSYCNSDPAASPINSAVGQGIFVAVASGNSGWSDGIASPACVENATSVGATDDSDDVAWFSNSAAILDLLAPGVSIKSTVPTGSCSPYCDSSGYYILSGTSMATPHVAGAAALLFQYNSSMTPYDVRRTLNNTGKLITDTRNSILFPRIDLLAAIASLDNEVPVLSFVNPTPANNTVTNTSVLINISSNEIIATALLEWNGTTNETMNVSGLYATRNKSGISGVYSYKVYANDTFGNFGVTGTYILNANNSAPNITGFTPDAAIVNISEPQNRTFNISYNDTDGDTVSVAWYRNGTQVSTADNYTFIGNYSTAGTYNISVNITDSYLSDFHSWLLVVNNTNRAPSFNQTPQNQAMEEDTSLTIQINVSDIDGDTLIFDGINFGVAEEIRFEPSGNNTWKLVMKNKNGDNVSQGVYGYNGSEVVFGPIEGANHRQIRLANSQTLSKYDYFVVGDGQASGHSTILQYRGINTGDDKVKLKDMSSGEIYEPIHDSNGSATLTLPGGYNVTVNVSDQSSSTSLLKIISGAQTYMYSSLGAKIEFDVLGRGINITSEQTANNSVDIISFGKNGEGFLYYNATIGLTGDYDNISGVAKIKIGNGSKYEGFTGYGIKLERNEPASAQNNFTIIYPDEQVNRTGDTSLSINSIGFLNYTPPLNFNGIVYIDIRVADSEINNSVIITVNVTPVNDAPDLGYLQNITVNETGLVDINSSGILNTTDVDGDPINYSFSWPLNSSGQWLTNYSSNGTYYSTINATDGSLVTSKIIKIIVLGKNRAPNATVMYPNGGETLKIINVVNASATDPEGNTTISIVYFYYSNDTINWFLIGNDTDSSDTIYNITWNTTSIYSGPNYTIKVNASDSSGNFSSDTSDSEFLIDNTAPTVTAVYPNASSVTVTANITINFSENVNSSVFNYSTIAVRDSSGSIVKAEVSFDSAANTTIFSPYVPLAYNTTYIVNVTNVFTDLLGNVMVSPFLWNFTTAHLDTDGDGNPDYNESGAGDDLDNDGLNNSIDTIKGNRSNIFTTLSSLNMTVNGSSNISKAFTGTHVVNITNGTEPVVEFDWNFANELDLTNVTVKKNENSSIGSFLVRGLSLPSGTKTVYVDRILSSQGVCVKDVEVDSVTEISSNCKGVSETFVPCNGTEGQYTCTIVGTKFRIAGLSHSAGEEQNDTSPPLITSISTSSSGTTTVTVTLSVATDESSTCRYGTSNTNYAALAYLMSGTGTSHTATQDFTSDSSGTYYVRCNDTIGNVMTVSNSTTYSADVSTTTTTTTGDGGVTGGTTSSQKDKASHTFISMKAGERNRMKVSVKSLAVTSNIFVLNRNFQKAKITIQKVNESQAPSNISDAYQYFRVDADLLDSDVSFAEIEFRVNKTWLSGFDIDSVYLQRYVNNRWARLQTSRINSTADYYHYMAKTPGFSYFAITAEKSVPAVQAAAVAEPAGKETAETPPAVISAEDIHVVEEKEPGEKNETAYELTPEKERASRIIPYLLIVLFILVFLVALFDYLSKSHKS